MKPMELYIADVPFDDSSQSKIRPALVMTVEAQFVSVFKITSRYINKSNKIKSFYYPIEYWREAGLNKASYIDIHHIYNLTRTAIFHKQPVGRLMESDVIGLYEFIKERSNNDY